MRHLFFCDCNIRISLGYAEELSNRYWSVGKEYFSVVPNLRLGSSYVTCFVDTLAREEQENF